MTDDKGTAGETTGATTTTTATPKRRLPFGRSGGEGASGSTTGTTEPKQPTRAPRERRSFSTAKARGLLAQLLYAVCVALALILAIAVLLIALDANTDNSGVRWILERAEQVDLGYFDLDNPIKDFDTALGKYRDVQTALFNYGIAAVVWLVIGKFLDRIVRA